MKIPPVRYDMSLKDGIVRFELPIKVSTNYRFYYASKDLPLELHGSDPHAGDRRYFETFDELDSHIRKMIETLEASQIDELKEKCILYSLDHDDDWNAESIGFMFFVVQKVTLKREYKGEIHDDVTYYREVNHGAGTRGNTLQEFDASSKFDGSFKEMAWSDKREAWFFEMIQAMATMAKRLKQGLTGRAEILARKIDQGSRLLLTNGDDQDENKETTSKS